MRSTLSDLKTFFSALHPDKNTANKLLLAGVSLFCIDKAILAYNSKINDIVEGGRNIKIEKKDLKGNKELNTYFKETGISLSKEDLSDTDLGKSTSSDIFKILDPDDLVSDINEILNDKTDNLEIDEDKLLYGINDIISKKLEDESFIKKLNRIDALEGEDKVFAMYHLFFTELFPLILAFLYTVAYIPTILKVYKKHIPVDITSFSHFAIVSAGLGINNGLNFGSIGYAATTILALITVMGSLRLEGKNVKPNFPGLDEVLGEKSDEYIDNLLKLGTNNTCVLDEDLNIYGLSDSLKELTGIDDSSEDKLGAYDLFGYSKELKDSLEGLLSGEKEILEKMDISLENGTEISISGMNNSYENGGKEYLIIYVSPKVV